MIKKPKGFTLLETILVVGLITLFIAATYKIASKNNTGFLVEKQAQYVEQIITSLDDYLVTIPGDNNTQSATLNSLVNPQSNLINEKIIPEEMVNTANTIKTLWGTPANINAVDLDVNNTGNLVSGFEIVLNGIPADACGKLASNPSLVTKSQRIIVNGNMVKAPGMPNVDPTLISNSCVNPTNTIQVASNAFKHGIEGIVSSNARAFVKVAKENKYNIAPTGTAVSSLGSTCTGGASWDSTISACICPVNYKWDGQACVNLVANNVTNNNLDQAGTCNIGQFWNQIDRKCQAICPSGTIYNAVTNSCGVTTASNVPATNSVKTLCIPGIDPSNPNTPTSPGPCLNTSNQATSAPVYDAGRYIPSNVYVAIAPIQPSIATNSSHTAQVGSTMASTNASVNSINACPSGSRPTFAVAANNGTGTTTNPIARFDGKNCQMCVNGVWDGDRCVAN